MKFGFPFLLDTRFKEFTDFIVHDLGGECATVLVEAQHNIVVRCYSVIIAFGRKWLDEDEVCVAVISYHHVSVSNSGSDGKLSCVIQVEFVNWFNPDVYFV